MLHLGKRYFGLLTVLVSIFASCSDDALIYRDRTGLYSGYVGPYNYGYNYGSVSPTTVRPVRPVVRYTIPYDGHTSYYNTYAPYLSPFHTGTYYNYRSTYTRPYWQTSYAPYWGVRSYFYCRNAWTFGFNYSWARPCVYPVVSHPWVLASGHLHTAFVALSNSNSTDFEKALTLALNQIPPDSEQYIQLRDLLSAGTSDEPNQALAFLEAFDSVAKNISYEETNPSGDS